LGERTGAHDPIVSRLDVSWQSPKREFLVVLDPSNENRFSRGGSGSAPAAVGYKR
jgi:hypothetical protein